jgi:hypothetical protein
MSADAPASLSAGAGSSGSSDGTRRGEPGGLGPMARRAARVILIVSPIVGLIVARVPICMFARVTHHPCPGCGLTRATFALLHGHLGESLSFHPLAIVISPLLVAYVTYNSVSYVITGRWSSPGRIDRVTTKGSMALIVIMLAVWLARFFGAFGGPVPV